MSEVVGYRFHPTDQELVDYYLRHKILGNECIIGEVIREVNLCKFDPWQLPGQSGLETNDYVWYFFCPKDTKYQKSKRTNRTTASGFWKATGVDRKVRLKDGNREIIGTKKTLVFYTGRVPTGKRTEWVMHEYSPAFIPPGESPYSVCKVKNKSVGILCAPSTRSEMDSSAKASDFSNLASMEINQPIKGQLPNDYCGSDYNLALQLSAEGLYLSDIPELGSSNLLNEPVYNLANDDRNFLNDLEYVDPKFVEALFVDEPDVARENSLNEYHHDYLPLNSQTGTYTESSSEAEVDIAYRNDEYTEVYVGRKFEAKAMHNAAQGNHMKDRFWLRSSPEISPRYEVMRSPETSAITNSSQAKNSSVNKSERRGKVVQIPYRRNTSTPALREPSVKKKLKTSMIILEATEINPISLCLRNVLLGGLLLVIALWGIVIVR